MAHYRCPYCNVLIEHKAELAGSAVQCTKCQGKYYEPTDPLPGVPPMKVLTTLNQREEIDPREEDTLLQAATLPEPADLVEELRSRGISSILFTWKTNHTQEARMSFSKHLSRSEAFGKVIQIALRLLEKNPLKCIV